MSEPTDSEIVEQILAGDIDRYEVLIARYQRSLWTLCAYYIHNRSQIQEAVDAAFIKAYYALDSFELDRDFRAWLMQIARNEVRQLLRSMMRETSVKERYLEHVAAMRALDELEQGRDEEMKGYLDDCIQHLPQSQRALIEACYARGKSIAEMATDLQRSGDAVKKNLSRVRMQLRECIERKAVSNA